MSTELSIRPDQTQFDSNQMAALRSLGVTNASNEDVALFFHQAARTGLDPFARQIYLINRGGKQTIQVGIDGFRLIRDRKGTYQGHDEEWCGPDGTWKDVWLDPKLPPAAARVSVYVKGYQRPVVGIALWSEYAQVGRDGKPQSVWASKPALMLAKCAEALALRKAYPQDLSGLYTSDELPEAEQDADGVHVVTTMQADSRKPPARAAQNSRKTPASKPGPGTADATRDQGAVFNEWTTRIDETTTFDTLVQLHTEAANRGVLDHSYGRTTLEDVFVARREEIRNVGEQAQAGESEPQVHLSDEEGDYQDSVPF